mgnify:CR=1 FL=1
MREKVNKREKIMNNIREHKYELVLILIVLVQVIYISCMFGINKQGFHSDEIWNYGFANSTEGAHLYQSDKGYIPKNLNSWQSSENFRKYITVDKDEIFNYSSIYWNAECDFNPPLGYMMLHFICSLFPGTWSKWYCFALNIMCFVIMQLYLYKIGYSVTKDKKVGLLTVLFFGFTMGAINITIFLRIYAPATMFGVMLMYYSHMLFDLKDDGLTHKDVYIKLFFVTLAGSFTLHFFLAYAFIIAAMYSIYYLFTRHFKHFWTYGITMTLSVLLSIIIFPSTIRHTTGIGGEQVLSYMSKKYSFAWQNKIYWAYLTNDLFGIHNSIWKTMTGVYIAYAVGIVLFITLPLCFVFRHEKWLKKVFCWVKNKAIEIFRSIKKCSYSLVVMIAAVVFVIVIAAAKTSVGGMGRYCTRYIFMIYPIMACFSIIIVWYIISYIVRKINIKMVLCVILSLIFVILSNILAPKDYYFKHYEDGKTLTMLENNANCIIVTSQMWLFTCYANELYNTQNYYVSDYESTLLDTYESEYINNNDPLYLILDVSKMDGNDSLSFMGQVVINENLNQKQYFSEDYLDYFKDISPLRKVDYVGTDAVFGRMVKIYRLN